MAVQERGRYRPREEEHSLLLALILAASATTVMLEATRVLLSTAMFGIEQRSQIGLLVAAAVGFPAGALGGPLIWRLGLPRTAMLSAAVLGLSRLVMQFWTEPGARIVAGSIALAGWGWLTLALLRGWRNGAALGVAVGLGLDLAIRILFRTLDLPWMPSLAAHVVAVSLVGILGGAGVAVGRRPVPAGAAPSAVALVAIGPALLLYHLVGGSLGLAQVNTGSGFPAAAALLATGTVLGLGGGAFLVSSAVAARRRIVNGYAAGIAVALGGLALWLCWRTGGAAPLGFVVAAAVVPILLTRALVGLRPGAEDRGIVAATIWMTASIGVQAALLLVYYHGANPALAIGAAYVALGACALGAKETARAEASGNAPALVAPAVVGLAVLAASAWHGLTWSRTEAGRPLDGDVTLMTYNIQAGFTLDDEFSLEAIAETIEAADPDIVALQEVNRGWPFTTGIDQALWLSHRLDMPFFFGRSTANTLSSVAILSKAPMAETLREQFEARNFDRGAVAALIQSEAGGLWVFAAHLAAPGNATEARVDEARQLRDAWDGRSPAVIMGDFNAPPDSPVIDVFRAAELVDVGLAIGSTAPTFSDGRRIDHIFVTPGIEIVEVRVLESRTSDHRPLVAVIRVAPPDD